LESTGSHGRGVERRVPEMRRMVEFNCTSTWLVWPDWGAVLCCWIAKRQSEVLALAPQVEPASFINKLFRFFSLPACSLRFSPYGEKLWRYVKPFSSNTGTSRTDGRTDGQTDRFAISISRVRVLTCDKKMTDWKRKIARWSCCYVSPGCYSNVRACVFGRVAQLH